MEGWGQWQRQSQEAIGSAPSVAGLIGRVDVLARCWRNAGSSWFVLQSALCTLGVLVLGDSP